MTEPTATEFKDDLVRCLRSAREALLWKADGLSQYDVRRPLTPTGTNVLGLLKHVSSVAAEYFGVCFDRPFAVPLPWLTDDAEPNADLWVPAEQSRDEIVELWHRAWDHCDATIAELPLDAIATVPWWAQERRRPSLHLLLVHMTAEVNRHAGHADIVRELIDGSTGHRAGVSNLPTDDEIDWPAYVSQVQESAEHFR